MATLGSSLLSAAPTVIELISQGAKAFLSVRKHARKQSAPSGEPKGSLPRPLDSISRLGPGGVVYPVIIYLDLPLKPGQLNFTLGAGTLAQAVGLDMTARVTAWSTRFQVIFSEYALVGARLTIRNGTRGAGNADGGTTAFYLDESSSAAPTAAQAGAHPRVELVNAGCEGGSNQLLKVAWMAKSYTDLSWSDTAVSTNPVYFKAFTDAANFGTPAACTQSWLGDATFRVAFRGLRT